MADEKQKSTFTISDAEIVFKLHEAAIKKAEEVLKKAGKQTALVNTGVGKKKKVEGTFENKDGLYEVGVAIMIDKWENAEKKDLQAKDGDAEKKVQSDAQKNNEELVNAAKAACIEALDTYFTWFAGDDGKGKVTEKTAIPFNLMDQTKVESLVQDYKDFTIPSLDEKKLEELRKQKKDLKPIVGYKAGFEMIYKGK